MSKTYIKLAGWTVPIKPDDAMKTETKNPFEVDAISIERLSPNPLGNPMLRWKVRLSSPKTGEFSLPFETEKQAKECFNYVRLNRFVPVMREGNIEGLQELAQRIGGKVIA